MMAPIPLLIDDRGIFGFLNVLLILILLGHFHKHQIIMDIQKTAQLVVFLDNFSNF